MLSTSLHSKPPQLTPTYNKLLNQTSNRVTCNFISQVFDYWATTTNNTALRYTSIDTTHRTIDIRYSEVADRSYQIANYFKENGISKGNSVALMLGQEPDWWYSLAGLMREGVALVPCSRLLTKSDLQYRFNNLNISGIITLPEQQTKIESIRQECPSLISTVTTKSPHPSWGNLTDIYTQKVETSTEVKTSTQDPCLYLYTSGTTGQPKPVQHNHDYPFFHWPTGSRWLQTTSDDLIYNASDTGWGFTVWITLAAWSTGSKLLITPGNKKFKPTNMLTLLRKQNVTIFCAAPTVLRLLVADSSFKDFSFPKLKRIVTVGEALDETVIEAFKSKGVETHVGFGQAETPLIIGRVDDQPHVPNTMGKAISPYKVVILDNALKPTPKGTVGQIAVDLKEGSKGGIMRGYANAPERTQSAFSKDNRYYLTGDWAKYREDGLYSYQGRRDDLIKSRGYRIGPDEVEKAGMSHPAIAKIAVVGVRTRSDSFAITVKAFVLLKPGYSDNAELIKDIQMHIKKETAPNKYPRLVECIKRDEWEQYETTSGKIRRAGLREREERKLEDTHKSNASSSVTLSSYKMHSNISK